MTSVFSPALGCDFYRDDLRRAARTRPIGTLAYHSKPKAKKPIFVDHQILRCAQNNSGVEGRRKSPPGLRRQAPQG